MLTNGALMAAYPDYPSYRDAGVYGTYPRKPVQNGDVSPITNGVTIPRLSVNGNGVNGANGGINGGANGHTPSENGTIRGILRNKYDFGSTIRPTTILPTQDELSENGSDTPSEHLYNRSQRLRCAVKNCSVVFDRYLRPSVAEFVAVTFSVFFATMIENELFDRNVDLLPRICIVSTIEGICMLVFLLTFRR